MGIAEARQVAASILPDEIRQRAALLLSSGMFSDAETVSQAVVKLEFGASLGINPAQAMSDIHFVKGRPHIGSTLLAAAVKRTGKYNYRVTRLDNEVCEIAFWELFAGEWTEVGTSSYEIADAKKAGIYRDGSGWGKNPRNMLFARALSNGARWYAPDAIGSAVYTTEEVGDAEVWAAPAQVEAEVVVEEAASDGQRATIAGIIDTCEIDADELQKQRTAAGIIDDDTMTAAQADQVIGWLKSKVGDEVPS
jgi:hypothetical protein